MMNPFIRKIAAITIFIFFGGFIMAQDPGLRAKISFEQKPEAKPFRILTNGKRITIQANKDINKIIVWTASGNRFVEQTNIEASSYNFTVPSKEKVIFIMLELQGGKRYTEKIGVE
jgi:hypothetical protein